MKRAPVGSSAITAGREWPEWAPPDADPVIRQDLARTLDTCRPQFSRLSGTSILITGGTGFVGRSLVESVVAHNATGVGPPCVITLLTRRPDVLAARYKKLVDAGEIVVMEWGERHSIKMGRRPWEFVLHAAAPADPASYLRDPDSTLRDMLDMAASVATAAKASAAARLVLVSSGAVYGDQPIGMSEISESYLGAPDVSRAMSCYGEGKRITEMLFRLSGVDLRIARVFSLIGPYQDIATSFAVPDIIRQAAMHGSLRLTGDGSTVRSYCYASDLSIFLFRLLLGHVDHDTYNVGSREGTVTIRELAEMVAWIFGGLEVRLDKPNGHSVRANRYVPSLDRMYAIYTPEIGLREGLVRTCHSLFNRGVISRGPSIGLRHAAVRG